MVMASGDTDVAKLKEAQQNGHADKPETAAEMTSKDYYFDSYAHFGIHEVGRLNDDGGTGEPQIRWSAFG